MAERAEDLDGLDELPLWRVGREPMLATRKKRRAQAAHARDIERMVPLAQELALAAGRAGITMANLRIAAENRGLLTGEEEGRQLSWLSGVMPKAGLVATELFRRSHLPKQHGIVRQVYVHPDFYDEKVHGVNNGVRGRAG